MSEGLRYRLLRLRITRRSQRYRRKRTILLAILLCMALLLVVMDRGKSSIIQDLRVWTTDLFSPILAGTSAMSEWVSSTGSKLIGLGATYQASEKITALQQQLTSLQGRLQDLETDNQALAKLLGAEPLAQRPVLSARVISRSSAEGGFFLTVDRGSVSGIELNACAVGPQGLIGRVIEIGKHTARIMVLTDFNSRIPVEIEGMGYNAILCGNGSGGAYFKHLWTEKVDDFVGHRIVTSGSGGIFLRGIPIGEVEKKSDGTDMILSPRLFEKVGILRVVGIITANKGA